METTRAGRSTIVDPKTRRRRDVLWAATILLVAAAITILSIVLFSAVGFAIGTVVVSLMAIVLAAVRKRLAPLYLSPVAIVSISFVALGFLGASFYGDVENAVAGGGAVVQLSPEQTDLTRMLLILAGSCVLFGGLITVFGRPIMERERNRGFSISLSARTQSLLLGASLVPLLITVVGSSSQLLQRDRYIDAAVQDGALLGLAGQLAIAGVLGLGYLSASAIGPIRVLALVGTAAYFLTFFATGSRRLAMLPLLFALGVLVARRTKVTVAILLASIPISLYLIRLALYLRALPSHGLVPYLEALPGLEDYAVTWDSIAKNVLISFGIIGATAFQRDPINTEVFWISINPLPGASAGWYDEAASLRLNVFTPYAGLGELANYGIGYLVLYCVAVGMILGVFDRQVQRFMADGLDILGLVLVGLSALFVLYSIQYNLRTSTRMLVYGGIAATLLGWLGPIIARRLKRGAIATPPTS